MENKSSKEVYRQMKFQKDWFDHFSMNWLQGCEGMLGIHADKNGFGCVYFDVPMEWTERDDFFELVYKCAMKEWLMPRETGPDHCTVCMHRFLPFHFRYKGKLFCRWCGSHYYLDGVRQVVTRSINA